MRNYLSYGGGVNSTAMLLLLLDEGWDFEAVYVDHGCDWPETRRFVYWLSLHTPITIIQPTLGNLYDYAWKYSMTPNMRQKWCTQKFKVEAIGGYVKKPCFSLIGFSVDEEHRAKLKHQDGIESRYPLLEYEISRADCVKIIEEHGLPVPMRSGCYFCPQMRVSQWKRLRDQHPDLFCKAKQLEARSNEHRARQGKGPWFLYSNQRPLDEVVKENQGVLFEELAYPPCHCEL